MAHSEDPTLTGLGLVHELNRAIRATWQGRELFRYVYRPWDPQLESPRPYLHPLRTLGGDLVSLYRPHDHAWHKGIAWSVANVGTENFWGGPTYVPEGRYEQLANNGSMRHDAFETITATDDLVGFDEQLSWITQGEKPWIGETRRLAAQVMAEASAWCLSHETTMTNLSGAPIAFGSPATRGLANSGYGGLFWRGPRAFTNGTVITPDRRGGDDMMGWRGPWLAYVGTHDGHARSSTVLFVDHPANFCFPTQWFVRSGLFACLCPAPFFSDEYQLGDGEELSLRYDVVIADGAADASGCAKLAAEALQLHETTMPAAPSGVAR